VTVTGVNFVNSPNLHCRWHNSIVTGTFLTVSTVRCTSPPHDPTHDQRNPNVYVTNNNQDYTTDAIAFTYQGALVVASSFQPASEGEVMR
jgi:hypothetical protein